MYQTFLDRIGCLSSKTPKKKNSNLLLLFFLVMPFFFYFFFFMNPAALYICNASSRVVTEQTDAQSKE